MTIPDRVSWSRACFFGPLTALSKIIGYPLMAFEFGALGVTTDMLDGWLAVRLNAVTERGKRFVDPVADFLFSLWVLIGFTWENWTYHPNRATISCVLIMAAAGFKILKEQDAFCRVQYFFAGFTPAYYCIGVITFLYLYAEASFTPSEMKIISGVGVLVTIGVAICKRNRLRVWWHDLCKCFSRAQTTSSSVID